MASNNGIEPLVALLGEEHQRGTHAKEEAAAARACGDAVALDAAAHVNLAGAAR